MKFPGIVRCAPVSAVISLLMVIAFVYPLSSVASAVVQRGVTLWDNRHPLTYYIPDLSEAARDSHGVNPSVVSVAAGMMAGDISRVSGRAPRLTSTAGARLIVYDLAVADSAAFGALSEAGVDYSQLAGRRDAFMLCVKGERLYAVGSDHRGTAYALLEVSRLAGVSPWEWWSDSHPVPLGSLTLPPGYCTVQSPSVEYRGVFLNDEDWSLRPWSYLTHEPGLAPGTIGPRTYRRVFELLLRLRANTLWPAMHEGTVAFFNVPGLGELADSCGIALGSSHCEPLLRNNVGEWDVEKRGRYNFITNRQAVLDYWTERLRQVGPGDNMLTLGMRGIHDGSMEGVRTMPEKVKALQEVIDAQRVLIADNVRPDTVSVPQVFIPYKEVLDIMERGLSVPDDVTLMWCDDNYGHLTRLSDSLQMARRGGAGVYYHLSYWGRPHDYLWLGTTQPGLIYHELREAFDRNARRVWIVNIHDPRVSSYGLELAMDMAWNIDSLSAAGVERHLAAWLQREFGQEAAVRLLPVMKEYYRLTTLRRPEHMGWSQVELDRKVYPRGRSHVADTEFSFTEFGGEAQRYLSDCGRIAAEVKDIEALVPALRLDDYFTQVAYPVLCADAMARKMLFAQYARSLAQGQACVDFAGRDSLISAASASSIDAYRDIVALTDRYNNIASGKWRHSMRMNPRDLYVFDAPSVPLLPADGAPRLMLDSLWHSVNIQPSGGVGDESLPYISVDWAGFDAADFADATFSPEPIDLLGHSMRAVPLPKGETLVYHIPFASAGEVQLMTALVPTHPVGDGPLRVEISVDGDEPQVMDFSEKGRTDRWKQNVLRNQVRLLTRHTLGPDTVHIVRIRAIDDHVTLDQLLLDTNLHRSHYTIPGSNFTPIIKR